MTDYNNDTPQSIVAEENTLGALLCDSRAWSRIAGKLHAHDFSRHDHVLIFHAIEKLSSKGEVADCVTVTDYLRRCNQLDDAGGFAYIAKLQRETVSASAVEQYAQLVSGKAFDRRFAEFGRVVNEMALTETGESREEKLAAAQRLLMNLHGQIRTGDGPISSRDLIVELIDDLDRRREAPLGISTGVADLDYLTSGLEPGDLIVIGARPGMGKTALAVTLTTNISSTHGVLVFSAEMPSQQIMRRVLAKEASISQGRLRRAEQLSDSDWAAITPAVAMIAEQKFWIDDKALPSLEYIRAESFMLKAKHGLGLVIIDYVQLVKSAGRNRYEELRDISYGVKALAKDLGIPVIVLAQLNRSVEARDDKRPYMSDLRDSGAIEEAADIVALLYREGYYDPEFGMPYVLECSVEKNRNGDRGVCYWRFNGEHSRITTLDSGARTQYLHNLKAKQRPRGDNPL
jgi:replicative DNA helicase